MTQVREEAGGQMLTRRDKMGEIYFRLEHPLRYPLNLFVMVFAVQRVQKL